MIIRTDNPRAYAVIASGITPALRAVLVGYAAALQNAIAPYPPASKANRPNARGRWYERGFGQKWLRKDGSVGGRKTSQLLNRSWSVTPTPDGARLANRATYSGWVHQHQPPYHKRRGWKTIDQGRQKLDAQRALYRLTARVAQELV